MYVSVSYTHLIFVKYTSKKTCTYTRTYEIDIFGLSHTQNPDSGNSYTTVNSKIPQTHRVNKHM